jgi:hypothetical protein
MGYDAGKRTTPELLGDWAAIMRELRKRDVIRTNNNPVGDIGTPAFARLTKKLRADQRVEKVDFSGAAGWLQPIVD